MELWQILCFTICIMVCHFPGHSLLVWSCSVHWPWSKAHCNPWTLLISVDTGLGLLGFLSETVSLSYSPLGLNNPVKGSENRKRYSDIFGCLDALEISLGNGYVQKWDGTSLRLHISVSVLSSSSFNYSYTFIVYILIIHYLNFSLRAFRFGKPSQPLPYSRSEIFCPLSGLLYYILPIFCANQSACLSEC